MKRFAAIVAAVFLLGGCTGYFERSADREVNPIVDELIGKVAAERVEQTPAGVIKVAKPVFNPAPPYSFEGQLTVEIECPTAGAVIRYSTDGEDPTAESTLYTGPVTITQTTTFKARASRDDLAEGDVAAGVYTARTEGEAEAPSLDVYGEMQEAARIINLEESLALAFSNSRDFKRQKEALYLDVLSLTLTRHNFGWIPGGRIEGETAVDGNGETAHTTSADADMTLSLARRLLSGGSFSVSASASQRGTVEGPGGNSNSSSVSASFSHQLLAGAGKAGREQLVQAERSVLYSARDFELFRQDLAISVITQYYNLLRQRRFVETARARVEQSTFNYERSEALFDKGRLSKVDVYRARQDKLSAENNLTNQIEAYNLALDRFKISLGLPTDESVDVAEETIEPEIVAVNLEEAVDTAFANRLDYLTAKARLEDVERDVEIARNALLPELEFFARANIANQSGEDFLNYSLDDGSAAAGLSLELPLDRKAERNAYKSSLISLDRERRSFTLTEDNIKLDVRSTIRDLRRAEVSLAIQKDAVQNAKDQLEIAQLLLEKGERDNRDVVDASNQLQDAENALVQAQVDYLIAYIQLLRDIGTLQVDETGQWR